MAFECVVCDCKYTFEKFKELFKHVKKEHNMSFDEYQENIQTYLKNNPHKSVKCELCGKYLRQITDYHLKPIHKINMSEYHKLFPNAKTISDEIIEKITKKSTGRKHSDKTKIQMHESRQKFLAKGTFIPPIKLKNKIERAEIAKKISISVRKTMQNPEVSKKIALNRKNGYGLPWNKGLTIDNPKIRLATERRAKTLEEKPKNLIFISKIEKSFLDDLEKMLGRKVKRQKRIRVDGDIRNVDGYIESFDYKIIIEVDGIYWHRRQESKIKDLTLDDFCCRNNIQIFRFYDVDIIKKDDRKKCINKIVDYVDNLDCFYEWKNCYSHIPHLKFKEEYFRMDDDL